MIDKPNNSLPTLAHAESGTGDTAVVTNKASFAKSRIDLDIDWFDIDLVIVEVGAIRVFDGTVMYQIQPSSRLYKSNWFLRNCVILFWCYLFSENERLCI